MIAENGRSYKHLPHLTEGDEAFRKKFLSWDIGDLSYVDIQAYLEEKDTIIIPMVSFDSQRTWRPLLGPGGRWGFPGDIEGGNSAGHSLTDLRAARE